MSVPDFMPSQGSHGYSRETGYQTLLEAIVQDAIIEHAMLTVGTEYIRKQLIPIAGSTKELEKHLKTSNRRAKVIVDTFLHPIIKKVEHGEKQLLDVLLNEYKDFDGIEDEPIRHYRRREYYTTSRSKAEQDGSYHLTIYYYGTPLLRVRKLHNAKWTRGNDYFQDIVYQNAIQTFLMNIITVCELNKTPDKKHHAATE